jgi:hypothetical protein
MFEKKFNCGKVIFVSEHLVGFDGGHPSNVDYYRHDLPEHDCADDCGQCTFDDDKIADVYHGDFCQDCK